MKKRKTCYWCGAEATSDDHVPPQNLFPKDKKKDLITVPSCRKHNEDLTKEDEMFRFYLQACSESPDSLRLFDVKTLRSITRPKAAKFAARLFEGSTPIMARGRETRALKVDSKRQDLYFEKITRGLFFHLFGRQLPSSVATVSPQFMASGLDYVALGKSLLKYLGLPGAVEGKVGQPEIFRFRYYHIRDDAHEAFIVRMIFYGSVAVLGMFVEKYEKKG